MKKLFSLGAIVLSLMFAFGSVASAQQAPDFEEMGLTEGYMRVMMAEDLTTTDGPQGVMLGVMEFEDIDEIEGDFEDFVDSFAESFFDEDEYEIEEVDDLGDEAYAVVGTMVTDSEETPASTVIALQDPYVFISVTMNSEDTDLDTEIVEFMTEAEPSDDEVDFQDDGTSTGGLFDMMPTADDIDGLEGMTPFADMDMLAEM